MDYRVIWEIDIEEVETALAAALEAHRIMLDPGKHRPRLHRYES